MLFVYLLIKSNIFKSFQIPKLNLRANVSDKILQSKQRKIFCYVYIHFKTLLNFKKKQAMDHIAQLYNNTLNFDEVCFMMSNSTSFSLFISMYNPNLLLWSQPTYVPPGILIWINLNQHYPRTLLPCFPFSAQMF